MLLCQLSVYFNIAADKMIGLMYTVNRSGAKHINFKTIECGCLTFMVACKKMQFENQLKMCVAKCSCTYVSPCYVHFYLGLLVGVHIYVSCM